MKLDYQNSPKWSRLFSANALRLILALIIGFLFILPLMWILATSLRLPKESFSLPPKIIPSLPLVWSNYGRVFEIVPFFRFIMNSFIVTFSTTILQLIFSAMCAFGLARIPFKHNNFVFMLILAVIMIPGQVISIPLFIMMSKLGLYNNLLSLIILGMRSPIAVFLMRQYIRTIPISLDEAVYMDGGSRRMVFCYVILPLIKPSLMVAAIIHLLAIWNDFFGPLIYLNREEVMTLPIGLVRLQGYQGSGNLSVILAGVMISIIVPAAIYIWGQRFLLQGTIATTGIKV